MDTAIPTHEAMTLTDAAAARASQLLGAQQAERAAVRVYVKSGGCSGYQYGMAIDDQRLDGDLEFTDRGVTLVVDRMSWPLLRGAQIDYIENMMGGGFSVNNPNATSACGCGHSFRTDGASAPEGEGSPSCS